MTEPVTTRFAKGRDENLPPVVLRPIEPGKPLENLCAQLQDEEIWERLGLPDPPQSTRFQMQFITGIYQAHAIHRTDEDRDVGFFILNVAKLKGKGQVDIDVAIPNKKDRGAGLSKAAFLRVEELIFDTLGAQRMFGWIYADNKASLAMVRSLGYPNTGYVDEYGRPSFYETDQLSFIYDKSAWETWRAEKDEA